MKINEITKMDKESSDKQLGQVDYNLLDVLIKSPSYHDTGVRIKGFEIWSARESSKALYYFVVNAKKSPNQTNKHKFDIKGYLELSNYERIESKAQLTSVQFNDELRGTGVALELYAAMVLKFGHMIMSDDWQTKGSMTIWQNLARYPGIEVYVWNRRQPRGGDPKFREFEIYEPDYDADEIVWNDESDDAKNELRDRKAELKDKVTNNELTQAEYDTEIAALNDDFRQSQEANDKTRQQSSRLVAVKN